MRHRTEDEWGEIVRMYVEGHMSSGMIAKETGMSRMGIIKGLKARGIDTSNGGENIQIELECMACGERFNRARSAMRRTVHHMCSTECYKAWLKAGSIHNEDGGYYGGWFGKMARRRVMKAMDVPVLPFGSVVHHINGNRHDNDPLNLMLFAGQGDHVKWHRGIREGIEVLWDGSV